MVMLIGGGGNDILSGTEGDDEIHGNAGNDELRGFGGQDRITGGAGSDLIDGGANTLTGGDVADYSDPAISFVVIDLMTGRGEDGQGGIDILIGIENLVGSNGNDSLLGDGASNGLRGNGGNDIIDGRGNSLLRGDFVSYFTDPGGVDVDLISGIGRDGFGGIDTLRGIEDINGSSFSDILRADHRSNMLQGFAGNDILDGRGGVDTVLYTFGTSGAVVDLMAGTARDGQGGNDTLISIENITGTIFADTFFGNNANNTFTGFSGDDIITGAGGVDHAVYHGVRADYTITGSSGVRTVADNEVNRDGSDTVTGVERLHFTDGILAFDISRTEDVGKSYLIYRAAFDRAPDSEGLGYWIRALEAGQDYGAVIAASFITSPEFIATYGTNVSNAAFLTLIYMNVLDRPPDAAGFEYWLNSADSGLNNGYARSNLLASFAVSNENFTAVSPLINDGIWFV